MDRATSQIEAIEPDDDPEGDQRKAAGLKPIHRLGSDERIARILPETDSRATVVYCSTFVRDFLARDFNFCAAKFAVARAGKLRALDDAFRDGEEGLTKALGWIEGKPVLDIPLMSDRHPVEIKHPLAGRLVRMLNQHDKIFSLPLCALAARGISPSDRDTAIEVASRRITLIHSLCIPDNDQYSADGVRTNTPQR